MFPAREAAESPALVASPGSVAGSGQQQGRGTPEAGRVATRRGPGPGCWRTSPPPQGRRPLPRAQAMSECRQAARLVDAAESLRNRWALGGRSMGGPHVQMRGDGLPAARG